MYCCLDFGLVNINLILRKHEIKALLGFELKNVDYKNCLPDGLKPYFNLILIHF